MVTLEQLRRLNQAEQAAVIDPGRYVARAVDEPLASWQRRALTVATSEPLRDLIDTASAAALLSAAADARRDCNGECDPDDGCSATADWLEARGLQLGVAR